MVAREVALVVEVDHELPRTDAAERSDGPVNLVPVHGKGLEPFDGSPRSLDDLLEPLLSYIVPETLARTVPLGFCLDLLELDLPLILLIACEQYDAEKSKSRK